MSDPVNPVHYSGRACADIGERLSANGFQILKYCWRLGQKDEAIVELGKAAWYADSEKALLVCMDTVYPNPHTQPFTADLPDPTQFLESRLAGEPEFTVMIARLLWAGYNMTKFETIISIIALEAKAYASS